MRLLPPPPWPFSLPAAAAGARAAAGYREFGISALVGRGAGAGTARRRSASRRRWCEARVALKGAGPAGQASGARREPGPGGECDGSQPVMVGAGRPDLHLGEWLCTQIAGAAVMC